MQLPINSCILHHARFNSVVLSGKQQLISNYIVSDQLNKAFLVYLITPSIVVGSFILTPMATPATTAAAAIITQYLKEGHYHGRRL